MRLSPLECKKATPHTRPARLAQGLAAVALVWATGEVGHALASEQPVAPPTYRQDTATCHVGSGTIRIMNLNIELVPQGELHYLATHHTGQLLAAGCDLER